MYRWHTMQTSGKMPGVLQSPCEFEFNKKRSVDGPVCRTAFSFEIKRRFLLPKPSRRIDSPVGHVGMENCAKAFSFSSVRLVSLSLRLLVSLFFLPLSLSLSLSLCTSFSASFHLVVLPLLFPSSHLPLFCSLLFKCHCSLPRSELKFLKQENR